jgi:hypothetical protein
MVILMVVYGGFWLKNFGGKSSCGGEFVILIRKVCYEQLPPQFVVD